MSDPNPERNIFEELVAEGSPKPSTGNPSEVAARAAGLISSSPDAVTRASNVSSAKATSPDNRSQQDKDQRTRTPNPERFGR